ncbi:hypothetical protein EV356DRAFT_490794 [Viridothelium virens]|uniref:DUF676 domain-containing protein n=1 Tax=Viridothelium virens TaxID=1048519 RepID=A0A6A6GZU7_VIRVR|nr:hypothetical protein EV356DRAFT_490794 [Viridothelium virens]
MRKTLNKIRPFSKHDKSSAPELAPGSSTMTAAALTSPTQTVTTSQEHNVRVPHGSQPTREVASSVPTAQHQPAEPCVAHTDTSNAAEAVDKIGKENHYGIRVLHNPPSAITDIVFVHGLTGSAYTTWLHNGSGVHGPRDLFAQDFPNARIMTFGYDADVVNFWKHAAQDDLSGYARDLLGVLADCKHEIATNRSIVFVAHSLGGLLDNIDKSRFDHIRSLETSTTGICFIGTPHSGSGHADWANTLASVVNIVKPANTDLLGSLQRGSDRLAGVRDSFHNLMEKRKSERLPLAIVCFYEQLPYLKSHIVPKESAIVAGELFYPIHANHVEMTKYSSREDKVYKDVRREIRRLAGAGRQD